jgi:hypothetical protein
MPSISKILLVFILPVFGFSQNTALHWQKAMGGKNNEFAYSTAELADGSLVIVGSTDSGKDGDIAEAKGGVDMWVVKTNASGKIEWSKCYGGTKEDIATDVVETPDGGILVVGTTQSQDGDAVGNGSRGGLILLKIKSNGILDWRRVIGSGIQAGENAFLKADGTSRPSLKATKDGNFILGASRENNVGGNLKGHDFWIAKINPIGGVIWQQSFGSSQTEAVSDVIQSSDGGYLLVGGTNAIIGEMEGSGKGFYDIYLVKVNANGVFQWQKVFGGSSFDVGFSAIETSDKGFFIVGETTSKDGDFVGNLGNKDGYIIKIATDGKFLWKNLLGGVEDDGINKIQKVGNNYVGYGFSGSKFNTIQANSTLPDFWMVNFTEAGTVNSHRLWGGGDLDMARNGMTLKDGSFLLVGQTESIDGDIKQIKGNIDFWVIKVGTPLTVHVADFDTNLNNQQNVLVSWEVSYETTVKAYNIYRSPNGTGFTKLLTVQATGNLMQRKKYNYIDYKPLIGKNFYQLTYTGADNKEVVVATNEVGFFPTAIDSELPDNEAIIYPNPSDGRAFYMNLTNPNTAIRLYDNSGKPIGFDIEMIETKKAMIKPNSQLPSGQYFIKSPTGTLRMSVF